jgi:tetratricopeptide (TPR) repeat protein
MGQGDAYRGLKRYDDALASYQRALQLLPGYVEVYAALARLYLEQDMYHEAVDMADQALALGLQIESEAYTLQIRGRAYYGLGQYDQALQDQNWIIENRPTQADFYYRALTYQAMGRKDDAITDLEFFLAQGGANDPDKIKDAEARLVELRR